MLKGKSEWWEGLDGGHLETFEETSVLVSCILIKILLFFVFERGFTEASFHQHSESNMEMGGFHSCPSQHLVTPCLPYPKDPQILLNSPALLVRYLSVFLLHPDSNSTQISKRSWNTFYKILRIGISK